MQHNKKHHQFPQSWINTSVTDLILCQSLSENLQQDCFFSYTSIKMKCVVQAALQFATNLLLLHFYDVFAAVIESEVAAQKKGSSCFR